MRMTIEYFIRNAAIAVAAVFIMAGSVSAGTVTFTTNSSLTGFNGTASNTLTSNSSGAAATLNYIDNASSTTGLPSNVDFGNFTLVCPLCSTQLMGTGAVFNPFTFKVIITDTTDNASGFFLGTSSGGTIFSDVSPIDINWSPLQLGPGTSNASSGNFGATIFTTTIFTGIVAPNSGGSTPGYTTIQGHVDSAPVPEPSTIGLIGCGLICLGLLRFRAVQ
jgi:hypothetical protein